jgi:hypothetical protein
MFSSKKSPDRQTGKNTAAAKISSSREDVFAHKKGASGIFI